MPPGTVWSIVSTLTVGAAADRDRDTVPGGDVVSVSVVVGAVAVSHGQGQGDHLDGRRCSRRRPGRIFYRALGLNVPPAGTAVHSYEVTGVFKSADVAWRSIESPPKTVWSAVWMLTVGSAPRTVIMTLALAAAVGVCLAVGHTQGQHDHLVVRRCSRRRPGRIFCSRVH